MGSAILIVSMCMGNPPEYIQGSRVGGIFFLGGGGSCMCVLETNLNDTELLSVLEGCFSIPKQEAFCFRSIRLLVLE